MTDLTVKILHCTCYLVFSLIMMKLLFLASGLFVTVARSVIIFNGGIIGIGQGPVLCPIRWVSISCVSILGRVSSGLSLREGFEVIGLFWCTCVVIRLGLASVTHCTLSWTKGLIEVQQCSTLLSIRQLPSLEPCI